MKFENVKPNEIREFCNSLSVEKKYFDPFEMATKSEFIVGVRCNDKLAGIGGLIKSYGFVPVLWIVVKQQFQRRGIGTEILQRIIAYAMKNYSFLILSTRKEIKAAFNLYLKNGFRISYAEDDTYWMHRSFNKRGENICKLLSHIYKIYCLVYNTPVGHFFLSDIRDRWSRFQSKKSGLYK